MGDIKIFYNKKLKNACKRKESRYNYFNDNREGLKMNTFNTKQEAIQYLNSEYKDYAETGVANVMLISPMIARAFGVKEGFCVDLEWNNEH